MPKLDDVNLSPLALSLSKGCFFLGKLLKENDNASTSSARADLGMSQAH
jgi:hypothetical protein